MPENPKFYNECQKFRQWWLWLILLIGPTIISAVFLSQLISSDPKDSGAGFDISLALIMLMTAVGPCLFVYYCKMDTAIRQDGVYIKFKPFHRKWVILPFKTITSAAPVTYRPIRDYGGWGIRYGSKGKAYNVSGDQGVLLEFTQSKPILIGSKKPQDLFTAIDKHLS